MTGRMAVKLRRDLWAYRSRLVLMVIAIAVSLTVFSGMLAAWSAIGRETGNAYMSTEPASATLVLDKPIAADRMAAIAARAGRQAGVIDAVGRTQFDSQVEVNGRLLDIPMQVFAAAPDDPMRMVKFDLGQKGAWPPSPGEIMLGRDAPPLMGVEIGDTLTITTPGGRPARLRVAGTVYDPSLSPSPQEQRGRGYLSTTALGAPRLDQLKIQVADPGRALPTRDRDRVVAVAGDVGSWLQSTYGLKVNEIQVPEPYAHPHQWQADVLLLSLLGGGTAALLLSTILVAIMLNNLFSQQIPEIGIMKAIGARSNRIGGLYLAMTFIVAVAATAIAFGPALLIGRSFLRGLLDMLGIQAAGLAPPWWAYVVIIGVGLGLPPLMALTPMIKASRISVRAAIDHRGVDAKPRGTGSLLARLNRLRGMDRGLVMALRNTIRRPARFWLSVSLLACAGTVFVAGMSLNSGTEAVTEEQKAQRYWDVDVRLAEPAREDAVKSAIRKIPGVSRTEASNRVQVGVAGPGRLPITRTYPDQGHGAVTLDTMPIRAPKILEGRRLRPGETGAVVLSQIVRDDTVPDLGAGDTVRLFIAGEPTTWRIAGIVEERGGAGGGVYATAAGLAAATQAPQQVNTLRVVTTGHDEGTRTAVAQSVERSLTSAGIRVANAASISRSEAVSAGHMGLVLLVLLGVALPLGVIGTIGLASTMSANVLDRIREFAIMHAIGARPRAVRRIVMTEGVLLALTSCLVAAIPALALTAALGNGLGNLFMNAPLPYRVSTPAAGIWIVLVILGSALATDTAATRASRITVREALTSL